LQALPRVPIQPQQRVDQPRHAQAGLARALQVKPRLFIKLFSVFFLQQRGITVERP
jgi:hypothetical protein